MAKNIVDRVDRNLARRLREARQETGLSSRAVAEKMPRRLAVSYVTIASYEKGTTVPPVDVLAALADIYKRTLNWFLDTREGLTNFRYRNLKARVGLAEQRHFEALAGKWVDAYVKLERYLKEPLRRTDRSKSLFSGQDMEPAQLAAAVRKMLGLDDDQAVQNTVSVLESFSALAVELRASFGIDGAAARHGDKFVVVLNPNTNSDRLRMNAAHELAHVLYDDCKHDLGWNDAVVERRAYDFASLLLLPESQLIPAFEGRSFLRLIQYKEKFGVSLAAMIYRGEQSRIINSTTARWLWGELSRRGWRTSEPGYVWRDRAITFEMMLESAIQTKALTWSEAERVTGVREDELRQRLTDATDQTNGAPGTGGKEDRELPSSIKFPSPGGQIPATE
jgi:Zn-dependent peptidase ImmA (M78 family)/transcriptional regulator with XRE-family HTH domain